MELDMVADKKTIENTRLVCLLLLYELNFYSWSTESKPGVPAPRLTWWRSGKLLDDTDEEVIHIPQASISF